MGSVRLRRYPISLWPVLSVLFPCHGASTLRCLGHFCGFPCGIPGHPTVFVVIPASLSVFSLGARVPILGLGPVAIVANPFTGLRGYKPFPGSPVRLRSQVANGAKVFTSCSFPFPFWVSGQGPNASISVFKVPGPWSWVPNGTQFLGRFRGHFHGPGTVPRPYPSGPYWDRQNPIYHNSGPYGFNPCPTRLPGPS